MARISKLRTIIYSIEAVAGAILMSTPFFNCTSVIQEIPIDEAQETQEMQIQEEDNLSIRFIYIGDLKNFIEIYDSENAKNNKISIDEYTDPKLGELLNEDHVLSPHIINSIRAAYYSIFKNYFDINGDWYIGFDDDLDNDNRITAKDKILHGSPEQKTNNNKPYLNKI